MCVQRVWHSLFYEACGPLFPFPLPFLIQRAGESLKIKLGIPCCFCAVFLFFYFLYLIPEHYSHCGVCSIISDPCSCFFYLFFFHNCLGVFFLMLPFHLFSPFLSISGVLISPPSFSYSLASRNHLRKIGMVVRNSYAYTSFLPNLGLFSFPFGNGEEIENYLGL